MITRGFNLYALVPGDVYSLVLSFCIAKQRTPICRDFCVASLILVTSWPSTSLQFDTAMGPIHLSSTSYIRNAGHVYS
jgi:hypothetical protein